MSHCLRITLGTINPEEIKGYCLNKTDLFIMVREIGKQNKPHIHAVLEFSKITEHTFRQGLKTKFGLSGNGGFSLEKIKKDLHSSIRYCCKGEIDERKPNVLYVKSCYNVDELNNEYWEFVDEAKKEVKNVLQSQTEAAKPKKVKSLTWSERTFKQIQELEVECNTIRAYAILDVRSLTDKEKDDYNEARQKVFTLMMKCLGKGVKKINENIIRDLFAGFINAIVQEDDEVGMLYATKFYNNLFLIK